MGVYIEGMEMPKSCYECWALDDDYDYPMCRITQEQRGYKFDTRGQKMDKCPLTEVPEPHGPLVDEDLIRKRSKQWIVGGTHGNTLNDFLNFAEIPIVIERRK